jgi:hypothetical protein
MDPHCLENASIFHNQSQGLITLLPERTSAWKIKMNKATPFFENPQAIQGLCSNPLELVVIFWFVIRSHHRPNPKKPNLEYINGVSRVVPVNRPCHVSDPLKMKDNK